jgi:hypothetical protein
MAGRAQQDKVFKEVNLELSGGPFFVTWSRFSMRNDMGDFGYMLVSAHFSGK